MREFDFVDADLAERIKHWYAEALPTIRAVRAEDENRAAYLAGAHWLDGCGKGLSKGG